MPDSLAHLDRRIASAWAALNGARDAASHSLNAGTCAMEQMCERALDELLEQRYEMTTAQAATA